MEIRGFDDSISGGQLIGSFSSEKDAETEMKEFDEMKDGENSDGLYTSFVFKSNTKT